MPPIEIGPARSVGPVQVRTTPVAPPPSGVAHPGAVTPGPVPAAASPAVERSPAFDPGAAPVDAERVAVIRRAVEQGNYPVIPTKIADAMIAAGMLLRSPQP